MIRRLTFCIAIGLLAAQSALSQGFHYFEMEDADTLGGNYVTVADTNVPPFAYQGTYITSSYQKDPVGPPVTGEDEAAVFGLSMQLTNATWDLYLRVHVGPGNYDDDSLYLADGPLFWDDIITNVWQEGQGFNGIAGLTGLDGQPTTADGFHWVQAPETYEADPYALELYWACAPREDGLDVDAFALVVSGFTPTEEMLNPANSNVAAWAGEYLPNYPTPTPLPELSAEFLDGAETVDPGTVTMTVNGTPVSGLTVSYSNYVTTVHGTPAVPLDVPSTNTAVVVATSTPGGTLITNEFTFEVIESDVPDGNIVYVDASPDNTLIRKSGVYTNWTPGSSHDSVNTNWNQRGFANEGTIITSQGTADHGRLKTSVSNVPLGVYNVYAYFWALQGGCIIEAALQDNPSGTLPLYDAGDYPDDPDVYVHYLDALDALPWGTFSAPTPSPYYSTEDTLLSNPFNTNAVQLADADRRMMQVYLGTVAATEFSVYVDEDRANGWPDRVWYDGVGYEELTEGAVVLASRSPLPGSLHLETAAVSLGAVLYDINETLDTSSVELYLDGGANLITVGDVTKNGITTTVDHDVSTLSPGTHTVDLVHSTVESGTPVTNSWSFKVLTEWPGTRVYVDADTTNTLAWDGASYSAWTPVTSGDNDPNWRVREGFANGGTAMQCGYDTNSVRLKTTVSGLPSDTYRVFAYHWVASGGEWRMGADLVDPGAAGELPLYRDQDYPAEARLYSHYQDAEGAVPYNENAHDVVSTELLSNPFTSAVQVGEGNRQMIEVYLGTVSGTEISVFVDDDPDAPDWRRTWYDGIGYEVATGGVWASPTIRNASIAGGMVTLTWESESIGTYAIGQKTSLDDADWTPVKTGIAGGMSTTTDSVPASGDAQEFFQISGE